MMAIRRKLPKQFEEPPASAVDHLDEIPRRAERVHKRKATLPDYWWHVEYVAGTSALPADEKVTGLLRTRELLRTQMEEDGDPEDDRQKSAVKNLEARIKTRLESARKAEKAETERSAGGHPVQPPGGVRNDTPRASGGRSEAAQRAAHSVSKHRVTSPTEWTAGTGPGEAHRAAENDFGPAPKRAKPIITAVGYIIEHGVCYLTLCDRSYPKRLAYQYLGELQKEFETQNLSQIETVSRPYAFIKFDTFIQKTKKLYLDTRTQRNLNKLSDDLAEVQQIVTKNIQDVLGMGDKLDQVTRMSNTLSSESKVYAGKARDLSRQALFKKWSPVIVVLLIVSLLFYFRSSWN
eukprot:jgi/Mesvir1/6431/Mv19517-RA.1